MHAVVSSRSSANPIEQACQVLQRLYRYFQGRPKLRVLSTRGIVVKVEATGRVALWHLPYLLLQEERVHTNSRGSPRVLPYRGGVGPNRVWLSRKVVERRSTDHSISVSAADSDKCHRDTIAQQ